MHDNKVVKNFLSQLRKFLPEKVIYIALSSLPEDIFDIDDYLDIPCLSNDREVKDFISEYGFVAPENIISFFMIQYMKHFDEIMNEIFEEMELMDESCIYDFDYNYIYAE